MKIILNLVLYSLGLLQRPVLQYIHVLFRVLSEIVTYTHVEPTFCWSLPWHCNSVYYNQLSRIETGV